MTPQDRIALVAETSPEFAALFFGVIYAGAWPVPLPLPTSFGARDAYVAQLQVQLASADPGLFLFPAEFEAMARDATGAVPALDWKAFAEKSNLNFD